MRIAFDDSDSHWPLAPVRMSTWEDHRNTVLGTYTEGYSQYSYIGITGNHPNLETLDLAPDLFCCHACHSLDGWLMLPNPPLEPC